MKKFIFLFLLLQFILLITLQAQYSNLNVSVDKTQFCSMSSTIRVSGSVTAGYNVSNGYHFTGLIFHFYYFNGSAPSLIGNYTVSWVGGTTQTSFSNLNTVYFNGSQISGGQVTVNTYNSGSPLSGGMFGARLTLPWYAFPTSSGVQFYVAVEGIDQSGSTTTVSSKTAFTNPILYPNAFLTKPAISSTSATLCSSEAATISTNPDLSGTYTYNWYKDGNWLSAETGSSLSTNTAGTYYAYIYDACQNVTTDNLVITTGQAPAAPTISSSNGLLLCDGASTVLSTSPSGGGTINWSNGQTGNSITVSSPGTYYAYEVNSCGTSANSNSITITTSNTPSAPNVSSSNGTLLCNAASTTLSSSPTAGGVIHWSTGVTGNSITVSSADNYYAYEVNSCGTSANSNIISISISNTPSAPSISSTNGNNLCNGASTILNGSPSAGGTIHWSTGETGNTITVSSAGNYYAYEVNSCGTSANSNTINITIGGTPPAPTVSSSNGTALCNGASTNLSGSPTAGGIIHWSTGQTGNAITVSAAGNYYAYEVNSCGTSANSNNINITVGSTPPAPSVSPSSSQLLCNGASITLSSSGGNISWSNGATGNTLVTTVAGTYYATDHNSCGNSANSNAVVITTGTCPAPSPGGSFYICPGTQKTLDAGAGYDSYAWSNGATTQKINVGPGNYTVTVTKQGCTSVSGTVSVNYYTVTIPTITPSGSTTICASGSVTLTSSSGNGYLWNTGSTANSITVNTSGGYYVTVTDANGCTANSAAVNVTVNPLPSASISGTATVCQNGSNPSITFTGSGGTAPYTFVYQINGGSNQTITTTSGNSINLSVPTTTAGTYTYSLVSVQESSSTACSNKASGSATITVNALPTAGISGNATVCLNSSNPVITFTGNGGTAPYTFVYKINGGSNQTITTASGNTVTVSVPTNTAGTFTYSLVSVQGSGSVSCSNAASGTATVVINALPSAGISGNTTVCQNSSNPVITLTGSNGVAPYTFIYKINGGSNQTITTTSGNSITVSTPTSAAGTFNYSLVSIQDASSSACSNTATGTATVIVNALPTASISGSATVCQNSSSPAINFTGSNGVTPYTFVYKINGGSNQTVTSIGNTATVSVPTSTAGTYTYSLVSVQDASTTTCSNTATGTATIVVNALPAATISGTATICQNNTNPLISFAGSGGSGPYTFSYTINSGSLQSSSATTVTASSSNAGTFTYNLINVKDNSNGCSNPVSGTSIITINPQPAAAIITTTANHLCNNQISPITVSNYVSGYSYTWYKDGAFLKTSTADTILNNQSGSFYVIPVSDKGCTATSNSDTLNITNGNISAPVITGYFHVCPGGKTELRVGSPESGGQQMFESWRWTDSSGIVVSGDSIFSAYAGQYQGRVEKEGCADSAIIAIAADDTEFPAGQLMITPAHIAYGGQVSLNANISPAEEYRWDMGNGDTVTTTNNTLTENYYLSGDSILAKVTAVTARNCMASFSGTIKIDPPVFDSIENKAYSGNLKDWNVFPNPFRGTVKVSVILQRSENIRIDLFTADGRWIRSWSLAGIKGENLFDLDGIDRLTPGVLYLISAVYNGQKHFDKIYKY